MNKIILGLMSSFVAVHSWASCTYNFDVTQAQLNQAGGGEKKFPINQGQKIGFNIGLGTEAFMGVSGQLYSKALSTKQAPSGDISVPNVGIFAFEYNVKVPNFVFNGNEGLMLFPAMARGTINTDTAFDVHIGYLNNLGTQVGSHSMFVSVLGYNNFFPVANTSSGYQRYGFYVNQDLKKIGLIVNGVNKGYVGSFTNNPSAFFFWISAAHANINSNSSALNQNVSIELITDKNQLQFSYPAGTKDMCGNTI